MSIRAVTRAALLASIATAALACRRAAPPPDPVTPATEAEAEAFGQAMAKALAPCDPAAVAAMIDASNLARRAARGRKVPPSAVDGMLKGATGSALGANLCRELGADGTLATYLRTRTTSGQPRPLVRILVGGGVNYLEFEIGRIKGAGEVRAVDFLSFASGETSSESLGRMLESMVATGSPTQALADVEALKQATGRLASQDIAGARAAFDTVSAKVRASKIALVLDVQIASDESEPAYVAAMERFARAFPDDPALLLLSIDRVFLAKKFEETVALVDKLDRQVGGDPYLETLRATALGELGRHADAVAAAGRCTKAEPTLKMCWFGLIGAQLGARDHAGVITTMGEVRTRFEIEFTPDSISAEPAWAGFVASPEGQAWAARPAE
ncbi:MAG: hypothetical protein KBG28_03400 [Kofleriaceae bacterium]|jgi:hypothetical protein|nr:hypothetical protein [Kofleriaceae bacterium]MBP6840454.1 hypothetical protein [Kofleriaceae bacterium]MBP9203007.1 hypothetical protein [Kofleriaceae bacterium]